MRTDAATGFSDAMKGNQVKDIRRRDREKEAGRLAPGQRRRRTAPAAPGLPELPGDEMTPKVRSAVMQLMDELDRLKDELVAANERVSQLEDMADGDPLVPVLNRRGFERELERVLAYVKRYGTTVTLVYFDLDDFKAVNDRYGHAGGDAALRHLAKILLANVRRSDMVARLGGDEFAIVLHRADLNAAAAKAEQLAGQVAAAPVLHDGREIALRMTWGATELRADDTVASVLERADTAMYEGKARRRAEKAMRA
jgi:diguanylate cyclase (GGDEF)-like protein